MTTKDKTGDRLVASIRRTREGAAKAPTDGKVAAKGSTARRATGAKKAATPTNEAGSRPSEAAPRGNYQSAGRVWPD